MYKLDFLCSHPDSSVKLKEMLSGFVLWNYLDLKM
jgi:hypothetical protein